MPYRIRITYSKTGSIRYTGHLDLYRVWERTIRRAHLPIAFSQGFHPQVRINLACALPLGFTSQCELVDLWLVEPMPIEAIKTALARTLSPGLTLIDIQEVDEHGPALQTQVLSSVYQVTLLDPVDRPWLEAQVNRLLSSAEIQRTWREKSYNLRPLIESLACLAEDSLGNTELTMRLSAREGATGRPEEVLAALGVDPSQAKVDRRELILA
jgi:radical SAM-linked protein